MHNTLIPHFKINGVSSYPDEVTLFSNMEEITFNGEKYFLCYYEGDLSLETGQDNYASYVASLPNDNKVLAKLTDINVTNAELQGAIWWLEKDKPTVITGKFSVPLNATFMLMAEKVVDATDPVDDTRFKAVIDADGNLTINAVFDSTGNYVITAERLNRGLERIGKPIELEFETIEFDVYATGL